MMHIPTQAKALKVAWAKRLVSGDCKTGWRQIIDNQFAGLSKLLFRTNLSPDHIIQISRQLDPMWQEIFKSWCEYNFEKEPVIDVTIIKQP